MSQAWSDKVTLTVWWVHTKCKQVNKINWVKKKTVISSDNSVCTTAFRIVFYTCVICLKVMLMDKKVNRHLSCSVFQISALKRSVCCDILCAITRFTTHQHHEASTGCPTCNIPGPQTTVTVPSRQNNMKQGDIRMTWITSLTSAK